MFLFLAKVFVFLDFVYILSTREICILMDTNLTTGDPYTGPVCYSKGHKTAKVNLFWRLWGTVFNYEQGHTFLMCS